MNDGRNNGSGSSFTITTTLTEETTSTNDNTITILIPLSDSMQPILMMMMHQGQAISMLQTTVGCVLLGLQEGMHTPLSASAAEILCVCVCVVKT